MNNKYLRKISISVILPAFFFCCTSMRVKKPSDEYVCITASGDSTFGMHMERKLLEIENESGFDEAAEYPYKFVEPIHSQSDINITNLEGPFTEADDSYKIEKKFNFKCPPRFAMALKKGNIDIVNVANNHIFDYSAKGGHDTLTTLNKLGIKYCGGGLDREDASFKIIEKKGVKVAFLGYGQVFFYKYYQTAEADPEYPVFMNAYNDERMIKEIGEASGNADIVVVSIHSGKEKIPYPTDYQIYTARLAIDSGADIVIMHHPHVLQGVEKYKNGVIFYSLGNFAFGGNMLPEDTDAIMAQVRCSKAGVVDYTIIPIRTHREIDNYQPFVPDDTLSIEEKVKERSKPFSPDGIKFFRFSSS